MWLIITKIDVFMLSFLGSNEEVAIYGVANRIIFFGLMATSVVSNVIYPPLIKKIKEFGNLQITKKQWNNGIAFIAAMIFGFAFIALVTFDNFLTVKYLKSLNTNVLLLFVIIQPYLLR